MKSKDLHSVWSASDSSRLTAKQYSFRLPVHVAAKLAAIGEMYPNKTRTQIVGDLLSTAIDEWATQLASTKGVYVETVQESGKLPAKVYEEAGLMGRFKNLTNAHHAELEKELGNESPGLFFDTLYLVEEMTAEEAEQYRLDCLERDL